MAKEKLGANEKVKRGTARTVASLTTLVVSLALRARAAWVIPRASHHSRMGSLVISIG